MPELHLGADAQRVGDDQLAGHQQLEAADDVERLARDDEVAGGVVLEAVEDHAGRERESSCVLILNVSIVCADANVFSSSRKTPSSCTPGIELELSVRKTRPTTPVCAASPMKTVRLSVPASEPRNGICVPTAPVMLQPQAGRRARPRPRSG